jgi:plastocyanin
MRAHQSFTTKEDMMRVATLASIAVLGGLLACQDSPTTPEGTTDSVLASTVGNGIPENATVRFGEADVGSPFPPVPGHDASYHAKDKVYPRTVVIRAGGRVTFEMAVFHQVAIYDRGIGADDIDVSATVDLTAPPPAPPGTVIIPDFLIDDAAGRLALSEFSFAPMTLTSPPGTFDEPGRYLVICTVVPHFVDANMYAWVIVK